jgi:thiol-disulfide isomerase/thioredoxin
MVKTHSKKILLVITLLLIGGAIFYLEKYGPLRPGADVASKPVTVPVAPIERSNPIASAIAFKTAHYPLAKELVLPGNFINSQPFELQSLIGKKVILLDFWTYSCINCVRTLPYLNAWYDKYKPYGLEIVGVHSPEFEFEKEYGNVLAAVKKFSIKYPVVQDNDYGTWSAYNNHYWPHELLIDVDGFIVHDNIGEGGYAETENAIQQALQELMAREGSAQRVASGIVAPTGTVESKAQSPETYFGAARNQNLANGFSGKTGEQTFTLPKNIGRNELVLEGTWQFTSEFAANNSANAGITYKYKAAAVYFVASAPTAIRIKVLRDGQALTKDQAGSDITFENGQSYLIVQADRLYSILRELQGASEHTLELIIEAPGIKAYTFTFG